MLRYAKPHAAVFVIMQGAHMTLVATACATTVLVVAAVTPFIHVADAAPGCTEVSASSRSASEPGLRAQVYPRFSRAPGTVRIQALVERAGENRALQFVVESGAYYRSSTIELSGAEASRVHSVEFRLIPAGTYEVRVELQAAGGEIRAILHDQVTVVG